MRKDIVITDENFDLELEKICEAIGCPYSSYYEFTDTLPDGYHNQRKDTEYDCDYIKMRILPDFSSDCAQAIEEYYMAYEFKNGFMILRQVGIL